MANKFFEKKLWVLILGTLIIGGLIFWQWGKNKDRVIMPKDIRFLAGFSEEWAVICSEKMIKGVASVNFLDTKGNFLLSEPVLGASPFSEGLAAIENVYKSWGFINLKGEVVIPCLYEATTGFSQGLAGVCHGKKWGFINQKGEEVIPCQYDKVREIHEGVIAVCKNDKWGMIDRQGKEILAIKNFKVMDSSIGLVSFQVTEGGRYEMWYNPFFNRKEVKDSFEIVAKNDPNKIFLKENTIGSEEIVFEGIENAPDFKSLMIHSYNRSTEVVLEVTNPKTKRRLLLDWKQKRYYDVTNYDVINYIFYEKWGIMLVEKDEKYGVADQNGREIIPCQYSFITLLNDKVSKDNLLFVTEITSGHLSILDSNGKVINPPQWYNVYYNKFDGEYIIVSRALGRKTKYAVINSKGEWVIEPRISFMDYWPLIKRKLKKISEFYRL